MRDAASRRTAPMDEVDLRAVLRTLGEMIVDRGYVPPPAPDRTPHGLLFTCHARRERADADGDAAVDAAEGDDVAVGALKVHVLDEARVAVRTLRAIVESGDAACVIVASRLGPTPFTQREANGIATTTVQFFTFDDMLVNRTRHELVPKHTLRDTPATAEERSTFPRILTTDPVVRYYNFPVGSVVCIVRRIGCFEPYTTYRVVSQSS
jgi:DNA-directed RNA polymerase subunit H (RpoH/RPB5)